MAWRRIWRHSHAAAAAIGSFGCIRQPLRSVPPPFGPFRRGPTSLTPNLKEAFDSCRRFSSDAWVDPPAEEVVEVPLAQTGEGIAECELLRWFVDEGAHVEEFQPLCEVQSDKATIEITSRYKGKVLQILFVPGDIVKVGESLLKMAIIDESRTFEGLGGSSISHKPDPPEPDCESLLNNDADVRGVLATPSVRQLAKQHGLDINAICGTGKEGRATREDVLSYATDKGVGILSSPLRCNEALLMEEMSVDNIDVQSYRDKTIPLRGFQRSMVKSMTMAAKVPHFHYLEEIDCDALVELKASFQNENTDQEVKHTFLPFLIKSLSMALSKYPLLNSSFIEESNEVLLKDDMDIYC